MRIDRTAEAEARPSPVVRPGHRRASTRARRGPWYTRPRAVVAIALILAVSIGIAGTGLWVRAYAAGIEDRIVAEIKTGAAQLESGRAAVSRASKDRSTGDLDSAHRMFASAKSHFSNARSIADGDPMLRRASSLPGPAGAYVSDRVKTLDAVTDMGMALSDAGMAAAATDRKLIQPDQPGGLRGGQALIAVINATKPDVEAIKADIERAAAAAARVDPRLLPTSQQASFASTKASIAGQLAGLHEYERLSPVILEVLGANGPRNYLIANEDPADLRGGGGYIGSYSLMSTDKGQMKLTASGDVAKIDQPYPSAGQRGYVAPPASLKQFANHGWRLGDAMVSPDFTSAGRTALDLYANETGQSLDGVIALDPWAVGMLLDVTGPITVPEYKTTVTAKDFPELVFQKEEYRGGGQAYDGKRFISTVAAHLIPQLLTLPPGSWGNLLLALNNASSQRHLQVYFTNPQVEQEMSRIGWSGATVAPAGAQEYMREVESNYGDTKANHFIDRQFQLTLTLQPDGQLLHHLVVSLKNSTPSGYSGGRHYRCYIRMYIPSDASPTSIGNVQPDQIPLDEQPPPGLKILDGWFQINVNPSTGYGTADIPIDWTTAAKDLSSGHRIYWQKQAGTLADKVTVVFNANGKTFKATTDLTQDRVLVLTGDGVKVEAGQAGAASLPAIGS